MSDDEASADRAVAAVRSSGIPFEVTRHGPVSSLAEAAAARAATGYERGTITPFGSTTAWPVVVDASVTGRISLGGGAHGVAITVETDDAVRVLGAQVADISEAEDR